MPYPRLLNLDDDTLERLTSYIESELSNHYAERGNHADDLLRWQKDYWSKPTTEKATFPFTGAATIVIPLSAIAIEAIHARTMTTMFALPQFVSAEAINPEWDQYERPIERFLDNELLSEIGIRRRLGDCFLEAEKFGTMIGKVGYEMVIRTALRENPLTGIDEEFDVVTKQGATFDAVPDSRFLMPYSAVDPQTAAWVGEEHSRSSYEVLGMADGGMFYPEIREKLETWITTSQGNYGIESGRKFESNQAELEGTKPVWPERLDWVELWLSFDVDGSEREKEIVVHYHRPSSTFLAIRYNWHNDLHRPYRVGVYFPVEHRWRGIGICKQNEQFQREVTTQHRQRLDNATLANMRMIKVNKLSGYGPKEPVFPGKMWFVDDMTHIDTFQLGEIYPSSYNNEQATLIYSQQRTGVNEVVLGMPQVGTPGTATSDLARIQEGNKKFDFVYANFREFTDSIIMDVASTIQQFGPRRLQYFDTAENGQKVREFFEMPAEMIRNGLVLRFKTAGQQQNKVLDRQNWQQIAGILQQYYVNLVQLAQLSGNPQMMQTIVLKGMGAATEAMRQLLDSFDVRNIDRIIVRELEAALRDGLNAVGAVPTGAGGVTGASAPPGMDYLTQAFSPVGANGNGGANRILPPV